MASTAVPRLLTVRQASELCGLQRWRLYALIAANKGPTAIRIGRSIRISERALVEWIEAKEQEEVRLVD
jgi:excisionase family DNA binding protein